MDRRCFAALILAAATLALAGEPRYSELVLSDAKEGKAKAAFGKDTPKIYLTAKLVDVPSGTKLRSEWIAVKTQVAPPNYKIDSVDLTTAADSSRANFSFSKPNAGWPQGDYRVDLFINGKKSTSVPFQIK
jgi:hypothetical protein